MEDFHAAFTERAKDVIALDTAQRYIAAMHFGGVAIECLLKHIVVTFGIPTNVTGVKEWKTETNNPGHTIVNPKHSYDKAIHSHRKLFEHVKQHPFVYKWLNEVEKPMGHFIDVRYVGVEIEIERYKRWRRSYTSLIGWLQTQNFFQP